MERVLVAQLRLHDDPERVEEAAADAQQRPHGVVGGGRGVHVPVQVVVVVALGECGDQVQVAVPGRDVHALVEGEQHGPADAQQGPRDLGLAGEGADVESLVAEGEGDDEGPRREEVRCRGGESGRGELHAGNVQVLRHRAPACMRGYGAQQPASELASITFILGLFVSTIVYYSSMPLPVYKRNA